MARSIGITTFGYAESRVSNTSRCLTRRAGISGTSSSGGIGVSSSTKVLSGSGDDSRRDYVSGSTGILANSYLYSATSSEVFPNFLILYYLLYIKLYPFYFIRYLIVIL